MDKLSMFDELGNPDASYELAACIMTWLRTADDHNNWTVQAAYPGHTLCHKGDPTFIIHKEIITGVWWNSKEGIINAADPKFFDKLNDKLIQYGSE